MNAFLAGVLVGYVLAVLGLLSLALAGSNRMAGRAAREQAEAREREEVRRANVWMSFRN